MQLNLFKLYLLTLTLSFNLHASDKRSPTSLLELPEEVVESIIADEPSFILKLARTHPRLRKTIQRIATQTRPELLLFSETHNDYWEQEALEAGKKSTEPSYLLDFVVIQSRILDNFLNNTEESKRFKTPDEWKKHALSLILTYYSVFSVINSSCYQTTFEGILKGKGILSLENLQNKIHKSKIDANKRIQKALIYQVSEILGIACENIANTDVCQTVDRDASETIWSYGNPEANNTEGIREEAAKDTFERATKQGISESETFDIACRMTEIEVWTMVLDPEHQFFKKVYQTAYSNADQLSRRQIDRWFGGKGVFESQIEKHLTKEQSPEDTVQKFLKPLIHQLQRISPKMFPSKKRKREKYS